MFRGSYNVAELNQVNLHLAACFCVLNEKKHRDDTEEEILLRVARLIDDVNHTINLKTF